MATPTKATTYGSKEQYIPGYTQVRHHEWRTATNSAAYLLPVLQQKAATTPNLNLLDIGCGSSTITTSLASYLPAEGKITATDISPEILIKAQAFAEKAGVESKIHFQTADIYALPFEDGAFDIVHASMVLSHLSDPVAAYKEMLRVTTPGGVVANRESDLTAWSYHPRLPGIEKFHRCHIAVHEAAKGQTTAGPRTLGWALKAGAKREDVEVGCGTWMYATAEERAIWGGSMAERIRTGGMTTKIRELNLASEEEIQEMGDAWEEWIATEDACHGSLHRGELNS
ncbi:hypothetical protein LTR78_010160 [Recurvomyces mirabilis]|uniref:Methyltransferase domain-containing protein n=1 Tax=Recurvomyces mirabilis TaxID=574656 RepID=A0AAE0TMQ2_9PEZI|nr:hypothetical protein LTR78_010160 [Recurvomyces mirabilis]KAK5149951.1 hypothetical protein LTS14_010556 [Recurvomyces mirabilis]